MLRYERCRNITFVARFFLTKNARILCLHILSTGCSTCKIVNLKNPRVTIFHPNFTWNQFRYVILCRVSKSATSQSHCGNYDKNFVKATFLLIKLLNNCFHGKKFRWERISRFSILLCTVWNEEKFSLNEKIFRQINHLVTYLVKPVTFTKVLLKMREREFL